MLLKRILLCALGVSTGFGIVPDTMGEPVTDYGVFWWSGRESHEGEGSRGVGPLVEVMHQPGSVEMTAVRPFYSHYHDAAKGQDEVDVLWPVAHVMHFEGETSWRVLNAFYLGPRPDDPRDAYRFWILPVLALGRNGKGQDYGAVFPLGGRIDDWFGRDRVEFALFPLYWHSELNALRTDHWLWPLISRTRGPHLNKFRIFPFYGYSEKEGEGGSRFILWPFWTSTHIDRKGIKGEGFMLFPLYGHSKTEKEETWLFLPPFFRHTKGETVSQNTYLWPFVQSAKTKDEDKFYAWPIYGRRTRPNEDRRFYLWPFVWQRHETRASDDTRRFRLFPFVAAESTAPRKSVTNIVDRYVAVWPVLSYERTRDGARRFRSLDLWPFRNTPPVERNLSPLWTLYKFERGGRGWDNELLWGVARWGGLTNGVAYGSVFPLASWSHDRRSDSQREWAILKGLVGYHRDEGGKEFRLLYFLKWRSKP